VKGAPLVIDFGGFVESRVIEAARMADITVVPLTYQSTADLMPAVKTVTALQPYCANIVLLINNTATAHVNDLKQIIASRFPKLPVMLINHSSHVARIADDGLSVPDIAALGGIARWQLRNILPQVDALYTLLDKSTRSKS
jgi:hypothetical protein